MRSLRFDGLVRIPRIEALKHTMEGVQVRPMLDDTAQASETREVENFDHLANPRAKTEEFGQSKEKGNKGSPAGDSPQEAS